VYESLESAHESLEDAEHRPVMLQHGDGSRNSSIDVFAKIVMPVLAVS